MPKNVCHKSTFCLNLQLKDFTHVERGFHPNQNILSLHHLGMNTGDIERKSITMTTNADLDHLEFCITDISCSDSNLTFFEERNTDIGNFDPTSQTFIFADEVRSYTVYKSKWF